MTVSCVLLGPALLLLTVSSESSSFASGIAHFADSLVRFASLGTAFADSRQNRYLLRLGSLILMTVSCVLLVSALLLLTVSSESQSFASFW